MGGLIPKEHSLPDNPLIYEVVFVVYRLNKIKKQNRIVKEQN